MTIHEAIPKIMSEIGAIKKDQTNKQQGFKYRGIDDVMNALQPVLVKYGVFVVPEVLEQTREERQTKSGGNLISSICKIQYTFFANDGTCITAVVVGEGMDSGDKATNKAMAIAFKYACFQVFCIPTEEMKDPDSETPEPSTPKQKHQESSEHAEVHICGKCGNPIKGVKLKDGNLIPTSEVLKLSKGLAKPLCYKCLKDSENG
jgi:hypothetical protein